MAWISVFSEKEIEAAVAQDSSGRLEALYDRARDPASGTLDHILQVHSLSPAGMAAHFELYRTVMTGTKTLRKVEREMIALHVSRLNQCHY